MLGNRESRIKAGGKKWVEERCGTVFRPHSEDMLGKEQEENLGTHEPFSWLHSPQFPSTHHPTTLPIPQPPCNIPRLRLRPRTPRQSQTMASTLYSFARIEAINSTALRKLLIAFPTRLLRTQVCARAALPRASSTGRGFEQGGHAGGSGYL